MGNKDIITIPAFIIGIFICMTSCSNVSGNDDLSGSLNPIVEVIPIEGAENTTVIVNRGQQSYFNLEFREITSNDVVENGTGGGWCIDWKKPIDSNGGVYEGIKLYSTFGVEGWNSLNYFLNIKDDLKDADPELTYREFQAVVWSLRGFPAFNMHQVDPDDLPRRMTENGELNFDKEKVSEILDLVEAGYEDFDFSPGSKFAIIAEMPVDIQTLIKVAQ